MYKLGSALSRYDFSMTWSATVHHEIASQCLSLPVFSYDGLVVMIHEKSYFSALKKLHVVHGSCSDCEVNDEYTSSDVKPLSVVCTRAPGTIIRSIFDRSKHRFRFSFSALFSSFLPPFGFMCSSFVVGRLQSVLCSS